MSSANDQGVKLQQNMFSTVLKFVTENNLNDAERCIVVDVEVKGKYFSVKLCMNEKTLCLKICSIVDEEGVDVLGIVNNLEELVVNQIIIDATNCTKDNGLYNYYLSTKDNYRFCYDDK